MKKILATLAIFLTGGTAVGADVSEFNPRVLPDQAHTIAQERVEVRQVGNVVEANFPWKGEQGITVKYDMGTATAMERVRDKRNKKVITETVDFGDGGFKIDVLLNERPDTNRFCYQVENSEQYDFFYQPELTPEEIADGAERPEHIVGSYAVYHKELKNHKLGEENYATGKVMHIPRPQVWEVDNKEATTQWAELDYDNGELCVTASQDFLDNATYPVRIDPTFGYTTLGESCNDDTLSIAIDSFDSARKVGVAYTPSESGTLDSIDVGVCGDSAETLDITTALYEEDSDGAGSHGLVASKENLDVSVGTSAAFETFTYASEAFTGSTAYILHAIGNAAEVTGDRVHLAYDTGGSSKNLYDTSHFGGYADNKIIDPWDDEELSTSNDVSIYVTYTADAGEATTTPVTTIEGDITIDGDTTIEQ